MGELHSFGVDNTNSNIGDVNSIRNVVNQVYYQYLLHGLSVPYHSQCCLGKC